MKSFSLSKSETVLLSVSGTNSKAQLTYLKDKEEFYFILNFSDAKELGRYYRCFQIQHANQFKARCLRKIAVNIADGTKEFQAYRFDTLSPMIGGGLSIIVRYPTETIHSTDTVEAIRNKFIGNFMGPTHDA